MISSNLKNVRNTPPVLLCIIETGNTEFNSRFSKGVFSKSVFAADISTYDKYTSNVSTALAV